MKLLISRIIAILLLVIPGLAAAYGFLEIKNSLFLYMSQLGDESTQPDFPIWQFIKGLILFLVGAGFIAGWTFYRDRRRNYLAPRFMPKRRKP